MKNKKAIYVGVAAIILIILIAGIALAFVSNEQQSYTAKITKGQKYLEAGNYDEAIVLFKSAVEMEPEKSEAYVYLFKAYMGGGYTELAKLTLNYGYNATGSVTFLLLQEENFESDDSDTQQSQEEQVVVTGNKNVNPVLNTELLSFFSGACYDDYRMKYGIASCTASDNGCVVRAEGLDADLIYYNTNETRVIDASNGVPYSNFVPNEISLDNVALLFGGVTGMSYENLRVLDGVNNLTKDDGYVTFEANGCKITISCDGDYSIQSGAENTIIPSGTSETIGEYTIEGSVIDATTGFGVSGATLKLYPGTQIYGTPEEFTTDSTGKYTMNVADSGNYTVVVSKQGYIEEAFEVYITGNGQYSNKDFTISPELSSDAIRIVLTWNGAPTDLDSYLIGTTDNSDDVRVSFTDKQVYNANGKLIAELDVDDTDGYGPETTTLYDLNGVYEFAVADFTRSGTMSSSGAQVKIYMGNTLVETVNICDGLENGWSVCWIDHGEIIVTNTAREASNGRIY